MELKTASEIGISQDEFHSFIGKMMLEELGDFLKSDITINGYALILPKASYLDIMSRLRIFRFKKDFKYLYVFKKQTLNCKKLNNFENTVFIK